MAELIASATALCTLAHRTRGVSKRSPLAFCGKTVNWSSSGPMINTSSKKSSAAAMTGCSSSTAATSGASTSSSRRWQALTDDEMRAKTDRVSRARRQRRAARRHPARSLCGRARSEQAHARHAPLRRAADRRHGAATTARSPKCAPAKARRSSPRCPSYLNALTGNGVHIVTVNDYLAQRDAEWMGRIHQFLGMTVGVILTQQPNADKQAAYGADITYGTNNEFGFDYLRDNMEYQVGDRRQRGLNYAIVDEVDSILIDEARTPLIISGQADDNVEMYYRLNELAPQLVRQTEEKGDRRLLGRREAAPGAAVRRRPRARRADAVEGGPAAGRHRSLYDAANIAPDASPARGAARACAVPPRPAIRRAGRRSHHRRRVHRTPDGGPALVRRPAPGGRGEGRRRHPAREPDARVDHVPELLPDVRQARRA